MVGRTEPTAKRPRPNPAAIWLRQNGLRVTRARTAMIDILRLTGSPLPLGEVHAAVQRADGEGACDFATVFRFFRVLEEGGLVDKQPWVDGNARYELTPDSSCPGSEGEHDHHHHFLVCRQCQRTERIEQCLVTRLQTSLGKQTGYREIAHTLQFSGLCPRCQPVPPPSPARKATPPRTGSRAKG